MKTSVTLRLKKSPKRRSYLYLDYYPPYMDPLTRITKRQEYLGLYIFTNPVNNRERDYNRKVMELGEDIREKRLLSVRSNAEGIFDSATMKLDFLKYFRDKAKGKSQGWMTAYRHFSRYVNGVCTFGNITEQLCDSYRDYLINRATYINSNYKEAKSRRLSSASASKCYSYLMKVLKMAYKDKYYGTDPTGRMERIPARQEKEREFLTEEEVRILYNTPTKYQPLKDAAMFSIYTGLRLGDIIDLKWGDIRVAPDGKPCIRKKMLKCRREITILVSENALRFCGVRMPNDFPVFRDFKRSMTKGPLEKWIEDSGIQKHITFHCFRHTHATLLLTKGVDIYTVSGMLTHTNVKTTQIYAHLVDSKKRSAAEVIENII